jgi:deoxyadenosine/deoxycytidine kinase
MERPKKDSVIGKRPLVGVVGPCGAGKTALVTALRQQGVQAREVAQEHSFVPAMWQRITGPDLLIYLDVSRREAERRKGRELPPPYWEQLVSRLAHARDHADLLIATDRLTLDHVLAQVLSFLDSYGGV